MKRQIVKSDAIISVPTATATCPYCDKVLSLSANSWIQEFDGTWLADEIEIYCKNEADGNHNHMPYVYWLPVEEKIKGWLNTNYEFLLQDEARELGQWNRAILDWNRAGVDNDNGIG